MLKILQARLQQYVNCELPDVQARFRKGRETNDQIVNICWIIEKAESSRKTPISASLIPACVSSSPALPEEISITSDMQMTPPLWQKVKRS